MSSPSMRRGGFRAVFAAALACLALPAVAAAGPVFRPGAPGIGDPYFPLDGNGGYDVRHYNLDLRYEPDTDRLSGVATIRATATQNLSRFNLDLVGLHVRTVAVDGGLADWRRDGGELIVRPRSGLRDGEVFSVVIAYDGVPETNGEPEPGNQTGFIHTDDGALVVGQLHTAPAWFPVNGHPRDKAAYTFRLTVPAGLEAIANGVLAGQRTQGNWTTWTWQARDPMAPDLTTAAIGQFQVRAFRAAGIRYWDAIDPDLFTETGAPRTGTQFALSQRGNSTYKRLTRTIDVPASGGQLSFWVRRDTESWFEFMFVEAHTIGADDWTMLRDLNGHTRGNPRFACFFLPPLHPFIGHYTAEGGEETCAREGTTGRWWAATGVSDGYEQWTVDLTPYAGRRIELSISNVTDDFLTYDGVFIDDIVVPGGPGTTSFEDDGDTLDGWRVAAPPPGSPPAESDWIVGTADDTPLSLGGDTENLFDSQPEIIRFLEQRFGQYPFDVAGGILDDTEMISFALETQTRPVYARLLLEHQDETVDRYVVHELTHQWFGDSVGLAAWKHIWISEGFATYAEWLWSEHQGRRTAQEIYDGVMSRPADDEFWNVVIGDPGVDALFDSAVYARGAATLHALRLELGDAVFFTVLRRWANAHAGGNVTIPQFIALAERVSGRDLGAFFDEWLFTAEKPGP